MACGKQWANLTGAALSTIGAGLVTGFSAAASAWYVTLGGVIGTVGGISWTISGIMDLADCYEAIGQADVAAQLRQRVGRLQAEVIRLQAVVDALQAPQEAEFETADLV